MQRSQISQSVGESPLIRSELTSRAQCIAAFKPRKVVLLASVVHSYCAVVPTGPDILSPIMQDPIIFAGSVRGNLDPYGDASSDADMWAALKQAGLKQMVQSLPVRLLAQKLSGNTKRPRQMWF